MPPKPDTAIPPDALEHAKAWCAHYISKDGFGLMNVISGDPVPWDVGINVATRDAESLQRQREAEREKERKSPGIPESADKAEFAPRPRDALIEKILPGTINRLAIVGEGGSGKSEYTRRIAFKLAEHFLKGDNSHTALLPVHIELKKLEERQFPNGLDADSLRHALVRESVWNSWLGHFAAAHRVVFILDGMDEVRTGNHDTFAVSLSELISQDLPECVFILAGRPGSIPPSRLREFTGSAEHRIEPLTDVQIQQYADDYFKIPSTEHPFGAGIAARFVTQLRSHQSTLYPLIRRPFMLAFAAAEFSKPSHSIPSNPAELVERGLTRLFEWQQDRHDRAMGSSRLPDRVGVPECLDILSTLAAFALVDPSDDSRRNRIAFTLSESRQWLVQNADKLEPLASEPGKAQKAEKLIRQLAPASGVLYMSGNTVGFTNKVIAEFLAARWIARYGYPNWPYRDKPNEYVRSQDVKDDRERSLFDFFGDYAWTNDGDGLAQAVRFQLGKPPTKPAPEEEQRRHVANLSVLLRSADWYCQTAQPLLLPREGFGLDARGTLAGRVSRFLQALPESLAPAEQGRAISMAHAVVPIEGDWFESDFWRGWIARLPNHCRHGYFEPLRLALTKAMENPAKNGYAIRSLATAMATAFPGAGPLANEVLAALREALTKARENPAENGYAIGYLATAMATAFPGAGPLANEVLAALREALTKAMENPAKNGSAIYSLATAMATAFPGAGPLANEVLAALREALTKAMENPAENGDAIGYLATAMATAFPGAGPLANEVLAALREALTKAMENPAENGSAIRSLATAMATAFPGAGPLANEVLAALREALTKARENPAENGSAIDSLARAMATAFPGAGPLANEVLAALREALTKARENPAENWSAIDSLARAMATAFPGAGPLANEVLAALREALTKARENPAENGSAIYSLATAMATAFPGAGPLANEVLAALREALTKAMENPAENGFAIGSLARAMATAFPGAGPLANEVLAALREALTKARENPAENGSAIYSLATAMATAFPGAGPLANEVLAALREALTKAMENPAENGSAIRSLATAMATAFPGAGPLAREVLAALREALTKARENPAENRYAIDSLATAMATAFPGAGPLANEVLAALREALTKASENPAKNGYAIGSLATAMATAFPGRLDAAKAVIEAECAGDLDIESWNESVTLFGDEGLLQKYFIDSWRLPDDPPIIARLDRPIDPDDPKPQAVIVAPRENIRRGLPAWVLGKIIAGETERPFKVEECLPAVAKALNFELRKDAINIRDALSIIDDIKRQAFVGGHVPGNVGDETLVARLAGKFRELPETLRRFQELVMEPRLRIRFVDEKWAAYLDASDGTASDSLVELTNNEFVFFKALAAAEPRTGVYPADITEKFECGRLTPADIVNGLLRQKKRRNVMSIISLVVRPGRDAVGFRLAKTAWFPPHGDAPPPQK